MEKLTRRDLVAATVAAGLGVASANSKAEAKAINDGYTELAERRREAEAIRCELARQYKHQLRHHPTNGDEESLVGTDGQPNYIGNFSKGLSHKNFAEPDPASYRSLLAALTSGEPDDFEAIILGVGIPPTPYVDLTITPCDGPVDAPKNPRSDYRRNSERHVTRWQAGGKEQTQALLGRPAGRPGL